MLVLLTGLVLAFLFTVRSESASSKAYEGGTNARLLADSAVHLVISQIRQASTQPDLAWISQPGLIRTFDSAGKPAKSYKLYSADSLIEDGSFNPALATDLPPSSGPNSWKSQPNLYTDLNAPVADLSKTDPFDPAKKKPLLVYPIFDGNHLQMITDEATGSSIAQFSLNQDGQADVEGFAVADFPTRGVSMPVRWLYLLKDGTLATAKASDSAGDIEVIVPQGKEKTPQGEPNLPVARIAFWTDDESAKLNINTASEGTFWDTPIGNSQNGLPAGATYKPNPSFIYEHDLAEMQGAQKEFQRYPGHPATTCLSTIFGRQLLRLDSVQGDRPLMVEEIAKLSPRITGTEYDPGNGIAIRDSSSNAGSKRAGAPGARSTDDNPFLVTPDNDRLYATIDEFLYAPRFSNSLRPAQLLAPPVANRDTTREMLEISKFFLTANSKAPEQTLSNLPRVAIWPLQVLDSKRTPFDRTIAFCSTVGRAKAGGKPHYFTRQNPESATDDFAKIPNNLVLFKYLQGLTNLPPLGWDSSGSATSTFAKKYGPDRDQILTEIFDYIRTTNLIDLSNPETPEVSYTLPDQDGFYRTKRGQVVPIDLGPTRGLGRIATISELALQITNKNPTANPQSTSLEFTLVPKYFCPLAGFSALSNNFRITFKNLKIEAIDQSGSQMAFGSSTPPTLYDFGRISQIDREESKVGGTIGTESLTEPPNPQGNPPNVGAPPDSKRPSKIITVKYPPNAPFLTIKGTVQAEISAPAQDTPTNSTNEPIVQTFSFKFPETKVPIPTVGGGNVIRSLVATGNPSQLSVGLQGDLRLISARKVIDDSFFAPAPDGNYFKSELTDNGTHSLRQGFRGIWGGATFGNLVKSMEGHSPITRPDLPAGIDGVLNSLGQPGDWDTGPAFVPDGPYCNKPDEGARRHLHAQNGSYAESSAPYIGWYWCPQDAVTQQITFFSPNRQLSSPVMFGSLPTGVLANKPWQTLLFRPATSYLPGGINHPGSRKFGPPDHLLLDLFWLPTVEPYAISEPFATAGKINLNQQIAPFTNLKRTTALRALLKPVRLTAINPNQPDRASGAPFIQTYKTSGTVGDRPNDGGGVGISARRDLDLTNTIKQFEDRFDSNRPFLAASEICDIPLIPKDISNHVSAGFTPTTPLSAFESKLSAFWAAHRLTGDNSLERPYSHLYPRLTTRSNTYTVHLRVQTLPPNPRNASFILKPSQAQPAGEFRGSFLIERYLDANSATLVDSTGAPTALPTSGDPSGLALGPYRFRTLSSKHFTP
jgi:hypothetical protein